MQIQLPHRERIDILLIEDDNALRRLLVEMLSRSGYSLREALNGCDALRLKREYRFRLVITDVFMPEMDGLEVIIDHTRTTPDVPLLAMTGDHAYAKSDDTLKMARILGSHAIIKKPFGMLEFLEAVHRLIRPVGKPEVSGDGGSAG